MKKGVAVLSSLALGVFGLGGALSFFVSCQIEKNRPISFVDITAESGVLSFHGASYYA